MTYLEGDLIKLAEQFDVIVHGCNCFCTMNSGIAPQIKAKWPQAYEVDCATVKGDKKKLGQISFTTDTKPTVVNAYTQFNYGTEKMQCDYEAMRSCMTAIRNKFSGKKIGMPKIGAGLAGGDWNTIAQIIEEELRGEDVTVVKWIK